MAYCAILIPQEQQEKQENNSESIWNFSDKLLSGVTNGGITFSNVTTLMKNTANLIINYADELTSKFSVIALVQLLEQGKISNETAFGYLTQGFP